MDQGGRKRPRGRDRRGAQSGDRLSCWRRALRSRRLWQNAGLGARKKLDQKKTSKALSYVTRTHRLEETDSPTHSSSIAWSDIAIRHFEEAQERDLLTEALLDKAAIYLDLSQLKHNSKEDFKRISQAGDGVITRTIGMATGNARTEALRVSSRFYYNLARPQSFMLSDTWDNNYLLLAYRRAEEASAIAPKDIKNANQLLRAAMKTAKNPPQSLDPQWREKLRTAKNNMRARWGRAQGPAQTSKPAAIAPKRPRDGNDGNDRP